MREYIKIVEDYNSTLKALRSKTVANGCTPAEAASAARKVAELTKKHGENGRDMSDYDPRVISLDDLMTEMGFTRKHRYVDMSIYASRDCTRPEALKALADAGFGIVKTERQGADSTWYVDSLKRADDLLRVTASDDEAGCMIAHSMEVKNIG